MKAGGKISGSSKQMTKWSLGLAGISFAATAAANPHEWQLNMPRGVTEWSPEPYFLNNITLAICSVIGVVVFGALIYSLVRFRKSRGAVAERWVHNTKLEIAWTVIPFIILAVLGYLATGGLVSFADTSHSELTIKVTGYQWLWRYDYVDYQGQPIEKVGFVSKLDRQSDVTRQLGSGLDPKAVTSDGTNTYLLNVDRPLVVPVDTKIRFVITAGDVIHSWWVPDFGWKVDAIPGIANAAWATIKQPGIYRGQCAELCGQDHGFMPIVVKAVPKADFVKWLAGQRDVPYQPAPPVAQLDAGKPVAGGSI